VTLDKVIHKRSCAWDKTNGE